MKGQNIVNEDWDTLIILDACRYDVFKKVYRDYLEGDLEKRRSKGSSTGEWLKNTFPGKYDVTYVSANPYINSKGFALNEGGHKYTWNASEHFTRVIDVWDSGWNQDLGTVHPKDVNKAFLSNSDGRAIIHYIQPHRPYLTGSGKSWGGSWGVLRSQVNAGWMGKLYTPFAKLMSFHIKPFFRKLLGEKMSLQVKKQTGMFCSDPMEEARVTGNADNLRKHYEQNLRVALEAVADLVGGLEGKVVITADHGEAFGEDGVWEHELETHIPVLVEVPWLVIDKGKAKNKKAAKRSKPAAKRSKEEDEKIKERLRALGYN